MLHTKSQGHRPSGFEKKIFKWVLPYMGVAAISAVSLSKNINPSLVLVQPRKARPFITERLLMGRTESNQTNKQTR